MPRNRIVYVAILLIAASALLYLGNLLTNTVKPLLPWATGLGLLLLIVGVFYEARPKVGEREVDKTL